MEVWRSIPGFSRYEASSEGNLRSLNYKNSGKTVLIKPAIDQGYLKTMLQKDDGRYKTWRVHQWIALAFHGPANGLTVNHKDVNKLNNRPGNLEYITALANVQHATLNGCQKPMKGSLNGCSKLTEAQVIEIRRFAKNANTRYYGRQALADKYGVSSAHIKDIVTGRRGVWSHV